MRKATYHSAGVNLEASEQVKNQIKELAANTSVSYTHLTLPTNREV